MLDGNLQDQGLLIHFSLLALWGQPTSPGLPALPSALAKTDLNVTWGEGGGTGHRTPLSVLNQDSPGLPVPMPQLPRPSSASLIFTFSIRDMSHLRKPQHTGYLPRSPAALTAVHVSSLTWLLAGVVLRDCQCWHV